MQTPELIPIVVVSVRTGDRTAIPHMEELTSLANIDLSPNDLGNIEDDIVRPRECCAVA
ncbi:MAG: hypothetical protein DHS20C16_03980 [Phycisphaerae bacterium]|nr:MAG: hypothetical protein DHS20C16_03980 [Phycisphaerae bacterium]